VPAAAPCRNNHLLLDELDQELERRGHRFTCHADDLAVLARSERAGRRILASIARFLRQRLKLGINLEKSQVIPTNELSFLGFAFRGAKIGWSVKTLARFQREVKRLANRNWGVSMDRRLEDLEQYLRGWAEYFWISEHYRPIPEIDQWVRRRVRMCYSPVYPIWAPSRSSCKQTPDEKEARHNRRVSLEVTKA